MLRFLCIALFVINASLKAQVNLVPNPSFEIYDTCPGNNGFISYATGWFSPTGNSTDYFNSCSNAGELCDVPSNFVSYQYPRTGDGYAGIGTGMLYYPDFGTNREYVTALLNSPLEANKEYCVSFYLNLANRSVWAMDQIGALFTDTIPRNDTINFFYINANPQVESPVNTIYSDTLEWILVASRFTASGGEQYITIGGFRANSQVNYDSLTYGTFFSAYYFIDDVSVTECPAPPTVISLIETFNAFSPNGDGINDFFIVESRNIVEYQMIIFNRWGNSVFESNDPSIGWDGRYRGKDVPEGTYFYIISAVGADEQKYLHKGFIELVR